MRAEYLKLNDLFIQKSKFTKIPCVYRVSDFSEGVIYASDICGYTTSYFEAEEEVTLIDIVEIPVYTYFDNTTRIELLQSKWAGHETYVCINDEIITIPEYGDCKFVVNSVVGNNIYITPVRFSKQIEKAEKSGYIGIDETNKFLKSHGRV